MPASYPQRLVRPFTIASLFVSLALIVSASTAQAQSFSERKCRADIAKQQIKYVGAAMKSVVRCHRDRSTGELPLAVDCTDFDDIAVHSRAARAAQKLRSKIGAPDGICVVADDLLPAQYVTCPSPGESSDDAGLTEGIDDFLEVADCLVAVDNGLLSDALLNAMGSPSAVLPPDAEECQRALGLSLAKLVKTYGKLRRKCQRTFDKQGLGLDYSCGDADSGGKLVKALAKARNKITDRCSISPANIDAIAACGGTVEELRDCVGDIIGVPLGGLMIALAYELEEGTTTPPTTTTTLPGGIGCGATFPVCDGECPPAQVCVDTGGACQCEVATGPCAPVIVRRIIASQYSAPDVATQLSTGWSGTAHNIDVPDKTGDSIIGTCDGNCEECGITLYREPSDPFLNCRCVEDSSAGCTVIDGPDPVNCGGGLDDTCKCYFGTPLAISSGGTPVCVLSEIQEDYSGTFNLRTGEWESGVKLASLVYLGASQVQPCPVCNGDVAVNDGIRDGTCAGGIATGPCDVNGTHLTFGPTSYDCLPDPVQNVSGGGLQLNLGFSSGQQSLAANLPCDPPFGDCPCRVCSGDSSVGCSSNQDCADVGAGDCTAGGGAGVQPNECDDAICSPAGECDAGPVDTFCDGQTHPDGRGFITCITNFDCQALGAGNCTISQQRSCFPDPIVVDGTADPLRPILSTVFCIPPTTSAAVNASGGLPGPGTLDLELDADLRCANDPGTVYELPSGANCVPTSSTTTTTLIPPVACNSLAPPVCDQGTDCPPGQACVDIGLACGCQPVATTTTTTLPASCASTPFPACGQGGCPPGETCDIDIGSSSCVCTPGDTCADSLFPTCGGSCGVGQSCQGLIIGDPCFCAP